MRLGSFYESGNGVAKNGEEALFWYTQAHKHGNRKAPLEIAELYSKGTLIEQDEELASKWYLISANNGFNTSMHEMYKRYNTGLGVEENSTKALVWLKKAANKRYAPAQADLAAAYARGLGVAENHAKALDLYLEASKRLQDPTVLYGILNMYQTGRIPVKDYSRTIEALDARFDGFSSQILESLNCNRSSSTVLFGAALKCVNRLQIRTFIESAGCNPLSLNLKNWNDTFSSEKLLEESSELLVSYSQSDSHVALIQYTLPSHLDVDQVARIAKFLSTKYGQPKSVEGRISVGEVSYQWTLSDGIELSVFRGWPDTTTFIQYKNTEVYSAQQKKIKRLKVERETLKNQEQYGNI